MSKCIRCGCVAYVWNPVAPIKASRQKTGMLPFISANTSHVENLRQALNDDFKSYLHECMCGHD